MYKRGKPLLPRFVCFFGTLLISISSGVVSSAEHPGEPLGDNSKDSKEFFDLLLEGERYSEFHQYELAKPILEKAIDAAPLDTRARISYARNTVEMVKMEVFAKAKIRAREEKKADSNKNAKKPEKAEPRHTEAEDLAVALPAEGLSPELQEALATAEKHLRVVLKLSERGSQEALELLGQNYFLRQEWVEAEKVFEEDLRLNSSDYMTSRWLHEIRRQRANIKRMEEEEAILKAKAEEEAEKK